MKNVYLKNIWRTGAVQIHVEPPPMFLNQSKINLKTERDYVRIKLRRNPLSEKLDIYEFKMDFLTIESQRNSFFL